MYIEKLGKQAKRMKSNPTRAEKHLFNHMSVVGRGYRLQIQIGYYLADICIFRRKLVIEIDGESHKDRQEFDNRRDAYMRDLGFNVVRFTNDEVLSDVKKCIEIIGTFPIVSDEEREELNRKMSIENNKVNVKKKILRGNLTTKQKKKIKKNIERNNFDI